MKHVLIAFVLCVPGLAQQPAASKREIVSFTFSNSKSQPSEYIIQVANDCSATYTEKGGEEESQELVEQPGNDDDEGAPAKPAKNFAENKEEKESAPKRFPFSQTTCREIFDLAKAANYFDGDFEFRKHKIAYTGDRILGYFTPGVSHKAAFTWSENPNIQKLSAVFEGTVATLEAGPKLEKALRFDKLGLNELLKGLEGQAQNGYLKELSLIEPVLKRIATDPKVMSIARQRAQHLLAQSQALANSARK